MSRPTLNPTRTYSELRKYSRSPFVLMLKSDTENCQICSPGMDGKRFSVCRGFFQLINEKWERIKLLEFFIISFDQSRFILISISKAQLLLGFKKSSFVETLCNYCRKSHCNLLKERLKQKKKLPEPAACRHSSSSSSKPFNLHLTFYQSICAIRTTRDNNEGCMYTWNGCAIVVTVSALRLTLQTETETWHRRALQRGGG